MRCYALNLSNHLKSGMLCSFVVRYCFDFFSSSQGRGQYKGEGKYRALYDDIVANKPIWMSFFDEKGNILQAEHTCAILVRIFEIFVLVE